MRRVNLGRTGLTMSWVGLGTSAAYDGVLCPAKVAVADYPRLLEYGFRQGITWWDASPTYGTHGAIRCALRRVPRREVVLCSKTVAVSGRGARADVERALRQMGTEEIDIFLLQTMRSGLEFRIRRGAWQALQDLKREGRIRAIGVAAHGLGVLQAALHEPALDVVLGRINYAGDLMDRWQEDLPSLLAGLPPVKRLLLDLLPRSWFARLAGRVHHWRASPEEQAMARELFARLAAAGKEVLGMKIFGEGALAGDVPRAVAYAAGLPWLRAILVGACSEAEIDAVVAAASQAQRGG